MTTENLWCELPEPDRRRTAKMVCEEQASKLGEMTKNLLEARVDTIRMQPNQEHLEFSIVIPSKDNYKMALFSLSYPVIELYPVSVQDYVGRLAPLAQSEEHLVDILRSILKGEKMQSLLASLLRFASE